MIYSIFTIPVASSTELFAYAGTLFSDLWLIIALAIGVPLAFWIIHSLINFFYYEASPPSIDIDLLTDWDYFRISEIKAGRGDPSSDKDKGLKRAAKSGYFLKK